MSCIVSFAFLAASTFADASAKTGATKFVEHVGEICQQVQHRSTTVKQLSSSRLTKSRFLSAQNEYVLGVMKEATRFRATKPPKAMAANFANAVGILESIAAHTKTAVRQLRNSPHPLGVLRSWQTSVQTLVRMGEHVFHVMGLNTVCSAPGGVSFTTSSSIGQEPTASGGSAEPVLEAGMLYTPVSQGSFGNGKVRPTAIATAGEGAANGVENISWQSWGGPKATGTGTGCVLQKTGIEANCTPTPATVVAYDLGTCAGKPAYLAVTWFYPSLGETFTSSKAAGTIPNPACGASASTTTTTTPPTTTTVVSTASAPCTLAALNAALQPDESLHSLDGIECANGWAAGAILLSTGNTGAFLLQSSGGTWVTPPSNVCTEAAALGIPSNVLTVSPCRVS